MKNLIFYILWPAVAGLVFAAVVLTGIRFFPQLLLPLATSQQVEITRSAPSSNIAETLSMTFREVIARTAPAIVSIKYGARIPTGRYVDLPDRRIYETDTDSSQGSGVIISADGYIITSLHIFSSKTIPLEQDMSATMSDGRIVPVDPVAVDYLNDLVLLKVQETNLPFARTSRNSPLSTGDIVIAIGNPRNIGRSASFGIISALPLIDEGYLIQTDAAINPGNSGGALIDYSGNLIGITSTIVSQSGGFEGIGFATPAEKAIHLMNEFLESAPKGYLGIEAGTQGLVQIRALDIRIDGMKVQGVVAGSAAEKAGIQPGDIITAVNDIKVQVADEGRNFTNAISAFEPGEMVQVKVFREGEFIVLDAELGEERPFLELNIPQPEVPAVLEE